MNDFSRWHRIFAVLTITILSIVGLAGCSDSNNSVPAVASSTVSGTVAGGAALVGAAVTATGANGATATGVTGPGGSYTVSGGLTYPVILKAVSGATTYYSVATSAGTINITPLTTLALMVNTALANNLDTVAAAWTTNASLLTQANLQAAQAVVNANLATRFAAAGIPSATYDFVTAAFTANSTGIDLVMDGLRFNFNFAAGTFALTTPANVAVAFNEAISTVDITIGGTSTTTTTTGGTLPPGVASKVVTFTFCCATAGAPYTNGQQVLFTFSSSGALFLTDQFTRVAPTFTVTANNEYVWTDASGLKYSLSLRNGAIHEVNLSNAAGTFLGQFNNPVEGSANSSTGNGTNTGSVTAVFGAGPYKLAYSASDGIGIDSRGLVNMTVTVDTNGRMTGYDANPACTTNCERLLIGTNFVGELAGDARITMGRWNGGTTAGNFFASPTKNFSTTQGFHYIAGATAGSLPTGVITTYPRTASTLPTVDGGGTSGTLTGSVVVDYFTDRVAVDLSVVIGGRTHRIVSNGAFTAPGNSEIGLSRVPSNFGTFAGAIGVAQGPNCSIATGCSISIRGVITGSATGPTRIGLVYVITTSLNNADTIRGAGLF